MSEPSLPPPPPPSAEVTLTPEGATPRRSRGKVIGGIVAAGALLAAGTFAVVSIGGNGNDGGASTPEEVGHQLITALDNQDVLGVIDLLLPGERETFRQPLTDMVENLRRLTVVAPSASMSSVGGVQLDFSGVTVRAQETTAADITDIFLSGTATASIDGAKVPIGPLLIDEVFDGKRPNMDVAAKTQTFNDTRLASVQRNGRWYLSAFYSVAEGARNSKDLPAAGIAAKGASSPSGAVDQLLTAVADQKVSDIIASLDPTEAEALQRYAPLFLDDAQKALDDAKIVWSITDRSYDVSGSGSRRTVIPTALKFSFEQGEGSTKVAVTLDGTCVSFSDGTTDKKICQKDVTDIDSLFQQLGVDNAPLKKFFTTVASAFADVKPVGLAVHEVGGAWYVSPLRTGFDVYNSVLGALTSDELTTIIRAGREFTKSIDNPLGLVGLLPGSSSSETTASTPETTAYTADGSGNASSEALNACYTKQTGNNDAEVVQCINDGIAAGTIDTVMVPAAVSHPECGVADVYLSKVYSLADDEFTKMATAASPCFLQLVKDGTVNSMMVAYELIAPECLEGRNPYTVQDQTYIDRANACVNDVLASL
jgi:hypothetical protein